VNPARTMGTFLRVWRREWARLTRRQMARAVSRHLGRPVEVHLLRAWEEGQPPGNTDELLALERVLESRGMTGPELFYFRQTVFAALAARQYHELFEAEDVVHSHDIDAFAEAISTHDHHITIIDHVVLQHELERALGDGTASRSDRALQDKQTVALAFLKAWMAYRQQWVARYDLMRRMADDAASYLALTMGHGRIGPECSVATMRRLSAFSVASSKDPCLGARRLAQLATEAVEAGDPIEAGTAYFQSVQFASALPEAEAQALLAAGPRYEGLVREVDPDGRRVEPSIHLFEAEFSLGRTDEAEVHLARLGHWRSEYGLHEVLWQLCWGRLAAYRGLWDEAESHLASAVELAVRDGDPERLRAAQDLLERCRTRERGTES
jgi:hypothetical protein